MKSITKNLHLDLVSQKLACFSRRKTWLRLPNLSNANLLDRLMFFQALVVGFQVPQASSNQLAQECARLGFPISPQGCMSASTTVGGFPQAMYQRAFEQFKTNSPCRSPFEPIYPNPGGRQHLRGCLTACRPSSRLRRESGQGQLEGAIGV
jgi:hypothetical protein